MPKSCLKIPTPPLTPGDDCCHRRKCVAFSAEDLEQVYIADEWDRTPAEVAHKLSYGDVLELKAIQRSLPTASQLPDPLARRPHAQYLKQVPIGLLPLFDDTQPCNSVAPAQPSFPPELPPIPSRLPSCSSNLDSTSSIYSPKPSKAPSQSISPLLSPTHSTSTSPQSRRPKPNFAFLALLDTPEPPPSEAPSIPPPSDFDTDDSDHDLSTPALSTASLDTTPSPRDLSDSEHHGYFHLPPRKKETSSSYFPQYPPAPSQKATAGAPPTNAMPFSLYPPNTTIRSKNQEPKKQPHDAQTFDINGETYHFGPMSSPPDPPLACSPPLSPLLLPARLPLQSSLPKKYAPFFPFEQERGQDMQQPSYASYSRPATSRNQSPSPKSSTGTRVKEMHPSSPILLPYTVSMKRATGGGPCSNSLVGMPMVRSEAMVGGGKGSLEH